MKNLIIIAASLFMLGQASYLAFNGLGIRSDKTFTVRFKDVPPVIKIAGDISVYYRGYKVGKAVCQRLSEDQKYILFCIDITYKDLKLPANTKIILKTQDVFGDRYFDLVYPENPSEKLLANGDLVDGTAVYERVDKYLVEQMESGELGKIISNLAYLTDSAKNLDVSEFKTLVPDVRKTLKNVNALLAEPELRKTIKQAPGLLKSTVSGLQTVSTELPRVSAVLPSVNNNLNFTNGLLCQTNQELGQTNQELGQTNHQLGTLNPKIPVIPQELINQTDQTLKRYDCIGCALSKTMSKRCLLLKLMFGRPGEPFENCCPQNQTKR